MLRPLHPARRPRSSQRLAIGDRSFYILAMTAEQPKPVRKGCLRGLCIALGLILLAGLCLVAVFWWNRRTIGERILHRQLRSLHAQGAVFHLAELGPRRTRLADTSIADDALRVADIEARYSLSGLARLHLKRVAVQGLELAIYRDAGGWRIPLLDWMAQLHLPAPETDSVPTFAVSLPEARMEGSLRLVHHRLGEWHLPLHLTAAVLPDKIDIAGQLDLLGNRQTFAATLDPELTGTVRLTGRLADLSALHTLCRYMDIPLPANLLPGEAPAELALTLDLSKGQARRTQVELGLSNARLLLEGNEIDIGKLRMLARSASPDLADWEVEGTGTDLSGFGAAVPDLGLTGKMNWHNQELTASLAIPRLDLGPFGMDDLRIETRGVGDSLHWRLAWRAEDHGIQRAELAGQASLCDRLQTTATGHLEMVLNQLDGWDGAARLELLGTEARLENGKPAWQANLRVTCPRLAAPFLRASGLLAEFTAAGTDQEVTRLAAKAEFASASLAGGELQAEARRGEASIAASQLSLADLEALLHHPLGPLPPQSQASLKLSAACANFAVDLARAATVLEQPGLIAGELGGRLSASLEWGASTPRLAVEIEGACPELSIAPAEEFLVRLPLGFRVRASGTPHRQTVEASIQGDGGTVAFADSEGLFAGWQASLSLQDISPQELAHAAEHRRLPGNGSATGKLHVGRFAGELPEPLAGHVEVARTDVDFRLDGKGMSTQVASQGTAQNLTASWHDTAQTIGTAEFSLNLQATPQKLDGNLDLTLAELKGGFPDTGLTAESLRLNVHCDQVDSQVLAPLADDPLGFRANRNAGEIGLSLLLENSTASLPDKNGAAGISLAADSIRWNAREGWQTGPEGARLQVAEATVAGVRMEHIVAQGNLAGTETRFAVEAPLVGPGVAARIEGQGRLTADPSFRATLAVPEFTLSTSQGWVLGLADFGGTEFAATLSTQGSLRWSPRRTSLSLTTKLRDGEVVLPNQGGEVKGIKTELALSLLPAIRSRPRQRLRFATARIAQMEFGRGDILFSLDGPQQLFVEQALIDWCGGQVEAYALRFDAEQTDIEATVYARELDAAQFVSLFPDTKASGKGRLYGRIPVSFKGGKVGYGDGFLYSIPGENGRLQFQDLGVLAPAIRSMGQAGTIVADALTDFDYSLFRVDIRPGGHPQAGIRARLIGAKAEQTDAHPIHLNINIGGTIEEAINLGVKVGGLNDMFQNIGNLQRLLDRLVE